MTATADISATLRNRRQWQASLVYPSGTDLLDVPVYYCKNEDGTWSYRIDNPAILGGGHLTLEGAERAAVSALARALRGGVHGAREGEMLGSLVLELRAAWGPAPALAGRPHHEARAS